jgi:hypothetical protein
VIESKDLKVFIWDRWYKRGIGGLGIVIARTREEARNLLYEKIAGRLLCVRLLDFHKWAQGRLDRNIDLDVFGMILPVVSEEIKKTITDTEWREIADFFIESGGSNKVEEK